MLKSQHNKNDIWNIFVMKVSLTTLKATDFPLPNPLSQQTATKNTLPFISPPIKREPFYGRWQYIA